MRIPDWYFRLRDSGAFTVLSGLGYLAVAALLLVAASTTLSMSIAVAIFLFIASAIVGFIGVAIVWGAGRIRKTDYLEYKRK